MEILFIEELDRNIKYTVSVVTNLFFIK